MFDISSEASLSLILTFIVPGFVFLVARSKFTTGRIVDPEKNIIHILSIASIYYAILYPVISLKVLRASGELAFTLSWIALIFVVPAGFGALSGLDARLEISRKLLRRLRIRPIHSIPSAWDWKFGRTPPSFILVTMKDGTKFGGYFSTKSFASSDPDERDLFVEVVYQIGEDGSQWTAFPDRSIWLNGAEIQSIEFIGDEGDSDAQ